MLIKPTLWSRFVLWLSIRLYNLNNKSYVRVSNWCWHALLNYGTRDQIVDISNERLAPHGMMVQVTADKPVVAPNVVNFPSTNNLRH